MVADAPNHSIGINVTAKSTREFNMSSDPANKIPQPRKSRGVSHNFAIHAGRQCNAAHDEHTVESRGKLLSKLNFA